MMRLTALAGIVLAGMLVFGCGGYSEPSEEFLATRIQFSDGQLNKKNVTVAQFVGFVKNHSEIKGWKKSGTNWSLFAGKDGAEYVYRFTGLLTDEDGKRLVVFQAIDKNGKTFENPSSLLSFLIND